MRRDKALSQSSSVPVRLRTRTGKGRNPSRTRHRNRRTPPLQRIGAKKSVVPPITTAKRLQEHGALQVLPRSYHRYRSPRNVYGGASRDDQRCRYCFALLGSNRITSGAFFLSRLLSPGHPVTKLHHVERRAVLTGVQKRSLAGGNGLTRWQLDPAQNGTRWRRGGRTTSADWRNALQHCDAGGPAPILRIPFDRESTTLPTCDTD